MADGIPIMPLVTTTEPMGCHLQAIRSVGGTFNWPRGAASFDALLVRNHGKGEGYRGQYFTGTIVSIQVPDETTVKGLLERGFKLLGTQKGAHGSYKMALYGLGFE